MTLRVDFYVLKQTDLAEALPVICRIIDKAYHQSQRVYVTCFSTAIANQLDALLWTFHDTSFLPHARQTSNHTQEVPILIGDSTQTPPLTYDILINLSENIPGFFKQFHRVIEMITTEPTSREKARERYRFYRMQNCELHSHQL